MRAMVEAATLAAALGLMTAALVNFTEAAIVHAVFWAVLAVAALLVFFVLRVEELLMRMNRRDDLDKMILSLTEEMHYRQSEDWGDIDWTFRD